MLICMIIILREQIMSIKLLERRLLRLENILLNESVKLDLTTVFDHPKPDREKYILDQLSKLKIRSKLLGIGDRGYIFIVTKIDDNNYEFAFNSSSKSIFKPDSIIDDILRDRNSYYEFPKSVKLIKKNSIDYDDDTVIVYKNGKKIYSGEEDDEPMKREDWIFNSDFGFYCLVDYSSNSIYIKVKK